MTATHAEAHLRYRARQRRHESPGPDVGARSRDPGDDVALRHAGLAHSRVLPTTKPWANSANSSPSPPPDDQCAPKVEWIASEFLKTRLTGGYCSRHLAAEACPYANVCETCDNFAPGPEFAPALPPNSVTSESSETMPSAAAGSASPPVISGSSMPSRVTFVGSEINRQQNSALDPDPLAG